MTRRTRLGVPLLATDIGFGRGMAAAGDSPWLRPDRVLRAAPVANNCYSPGSTPLQTAAGTSRVKHTALTACTDLRLVFGGWYTNTFVDVDQPSSIPVKAAIEVGSIIYPVTFGGALQGTVDPGGMLTSDPVALELTAGTGFYTRTYASSVSYRGNTWSYTAGNTGGWSSTDQTAAAGGTVADSIHALYGPHVVIGAPTDRSQTSVAIVGDSIAAGTGDAGVGGNGSNYSCFSLGGAIAGGYIARALTLGNVPWVNIAQGGEAAQNFATPTSRIRRPMMMSGCTHAICDYGINDLIQGRTLAQIQADLIAVWLTATRRGCRVWQTTITPVTTSTDSWVTTANQAVTSYNGTRISLNGWLRDGAPILTGTAVAAGSSATGTLRAGSSGHPLRGCFEIADLAETVRDAGIWKANYTADGTHPTATAAAALSVGITTSLLVL